MTKLITLSAVAMILFLASCSCNKEQKKVETPNPVVTPMKEVVTPKKTEPMPPVSVAFIPKRIEVTVPISKTDTSYAGDGCDCPQIEKTYKFKVFFSDNKGKQYAIAVEGVQVLKQYEGSNDLKKAKLVHKYADNSDPIYVRAKTMYKLLTTLPYSEFLVEVELRENGDFEPLTFKRIVKDSGEKVGNAYIHKKSDEILWTGNTDNGVFRDDYY